MTHRLLITYRPGIGHRIDGIYPQGHPEIARERRDGFFVEWPWPEFAPWLAAGATYDRDPTGEPPWRYDPDDTSASSVKVPAPPPREPTGKEIADYQRLHNRVHPGRGGG